MAVILLLSGLLLYILIGRALWEGFNDSLAVKLRSLAAMTEVEDGELELDFQEASLPEFKPSEKAEYYQVWLDDTSVFARSPSLLGQNLEAVYGTLEKPAYKLVLLPDGRPGCIAGARFSPRSERKRASTPLEVTMVIGRETAGVEAALSRLRSLMLIVGLVAIVISAIMLGFLVRRGLQPAKLLAARIASVRETDLDESITCRNIPTELQPIVDRLNGLLARLHDAFQRERRFSADVAHELRTPLAGLRSQLEVTLSREREPHEYRDTLSECLRIHRQMHQMVEALLNLARADAGQLEIVPEQFDLADLVRDCWQSFANRAAEKQLRVDWQIREVCTLNSDRVKLNLVLQNLLDNAVTYGDRGGWIRIELSCLDEHAELTVSNTGGRLRPADIEHVFDRFWRGDASRQAAGRHCGLGLALCKTLTELLGGSIRAELHADNTFAVVLRLPAGPCETDPVKKVF